ncbi:unnamed protein product [Amoebophrya sp. A120]|nr:unnamed protein product [Amoebophrya sp. A120]|eukprot:GSA120T00016913001.1
MVPAIHKFHFDKKVILFGEGGFKFAAAYALRNPTHHLVATTLESADDVFCRDPLARKRVAALRDVGHEVHFDTDYRRYSMEIEKSRRPPMFTKLGGKTSLEWDFGKLPLGGNVNLGRAVPPRIYCCGLMTRGGCTNLTSSSSIFPTSKKTHVQSGSLQERYPRHVRAQHSSSTS